MTERRDSQTENELRFHDLTWHRVSEVLLVSSPYDAFILQKDGQLTEQVFAEYDDLKLSAPPRFTHVSTGEAAMALLEKRRFDLVLTMTSLADMDVNDFGRKIKKRRPGRPVVLLALDRRELYDLRGAVDPQAIDATFLWSGDPKILLAIIKYVEDRENLVRDIELGDLNVILVVEDSPNYYSSFLGLLYHELTAQSLSLYSDGANPFQRQIYMNARPRIVHATSYEDGVEHFRTYRRHLLAIICDVAFPRRGELDRTAGFDFIESARRKAPGLPVLLQSADPDHRDTAHGLDADFIDKNAHDLLDRIRRFLREDLGFGPFIFKLPNGDEIDRARNLHELVEKLESVPEDSLAYHVNHNHFSMWLRARNRFELARQMRPHKISDFPTVDETRQRLIQGLREARRRAHVGEVVDFDPRFFDQNDFIRLGNGSLGGKARGLAFLNHKLADGFAAQAPEGLPIRMPKTIVVTTEYFDEFLDHNDLRDFALTCEDSDELSRRFLETELPARLSAELGFIVDHLRVPLAVRSSSLLEDSLHQRLAGLYTTVMLANDADGERRLHQLSDAIKLVYASTFGHEARSYLRSTAKIAEDEKMAVIIQELIGQRYGSKSQGERFYPAFSGVAQSFNYYPIGPQKAEDGVVHMALGFGRLVVEGGQAMRFDPKFPNVLPQFAQAKSFIDRSQREFFALEMGQGGEVSGIELLSTLRSFGLETAEADGSLKLAGSVYCAEDRLAREDLSLPGPRLVTFNNILKHKAMPLPKAMDHVLELGKQGFGRDVEIEFAVDSGDWGRRRRRSQRSAPRAEPTLYLLQIRPFTARHNTTGHTRIDFERQDRLCSSERSLGNGIEKICDLVYVRYDRWRAAENPSIADEIGHLNQALATEGRDYILIGPGRWGTADPWLGIPVKWSQISQVRVLVEASPTGYDVEPSQGTHFFQNMTSLEIGYLALRPGSDRPEEVGNDFLDLAWLGSQVAYRQTQHLRWLRFDEPLTAILDGRGGRGIIAKPGALPQEQ